MKQGLVLEGGAMRGLFTAGVIDAMMEQGIEYDGIIGVSAGSSFGCNYKSHQIGRVLRYNIRFHNDPRYMGLRSLLTSGNLVGAEFAYHTMPLEIDIFDVDTFEKSPMQFIVVCTDCITGEPVYYDMDKVTYDSLEWLRASASMPVVTRPVKVDGRVMLDGGISDSIPLKHFQEMGYEKNVVVLTRPRDYRKEPSKMWPFKLFLRKYPKIIDAMARRHEMYNKQLEYVEQQEKAGNVLVIAPHQPLPINRVEVKPDKMTYVHSVGYKQCQEMMPQIIDFLNHK